MSREMRKAMGQKMKNQCVRLWQRTLICMVVAALLMNRMSVLAQDTYVTMSKNKWNKTVWIGDWVQSHQGNDRIRDTLATMWMIQLFKDDPAMTRQEGVSKMND